MPRAHVTIGAEATKGYQQVRPFGAVEQEGSILRSGKAPDARAQARGGLRQSMSEGVDQPAPLRLR
jgi:hypothetical protein